MQRVPPYHQEAEQSIIGAVLMNPELINDISDLISPQDFYREAHKEIYEAITFLYANDQPIDLITITNQLKERNTLESVGGVTYLTDLMGVVPTLHNVTNYAEIIRDKSRLRKLIVQANAITNGAYEGKGVSEIITETESTIDVIMAAGDRHQLHKASDLIDKVHDKFVYYAENKGKILGIETGFTDLDKKLIGLQKKDLIFIAARPSMGKSAFAFNIAQYASIGQKITTAIFSLEMPEEKVLERMVCSLGLINHTKARKGEIEDNDWKGIMQSLGCLKAADLYIDDTTPMKVSEIRSKCRKIKGLGLVIIDHLGFISPEAQNQKNNNINRTQEVGIITKALKKLAKDLDVPVILLHQLSRACEQRANKRPMLSDLRDSGDIEQDADLVMFIYRDEYYNPTTEKKGFAEIIIAKNRDGETGTVELGWIAEHTQFCNLLHADKG
ncbi:MAG TPA: replicative DNA helicase [Clostridia bacterium]|nr:replicative DNA helicase [Clostridia bacterium]